MMAATPDVQRQGVLGHASPIQGEAAQTRAGKVVSGNARQCKGMGKLHEGGG